MNYNSYKNMENICTICSTNDIEIDHVDELIRPCSCKSLVHRSCLDQWLQITNRTNKNICNKCDFKYIYVDTPNYKRDNFELIISILCDILIMLSWYFVYIVLYIDSVGWWFRDYKYFWFSYFIFPVLGSTVFVVLICNSLNTIVSKNKMELVLLSFNCETDRINIILFPVAVLGIPIFGLCSLLLIFLKDIILFHLENSRRKKYKIKNLNCIQGYSTMV